MKAICVKAAYELEIQDRPMPVIADQEEVLIKVKRAGICGSDMHVYHGTSPVATYPRVMGHEIAGEVMEIGASVNHLVVGDRVVIDPVISCGECYQCRIGRQNVCSKLQVRSVHVDGGFQEYVVVPQKSLHKIPDNISWEEAVMIEPFTIAEQTCWRAGLTKDDTVLIMGAGPVGLSVLKRARISGAKCIVSDIVESRLQMVMAFGAEAVINAATENVLERIVQLTDGQKPSVVIDAVCTIKSFEQTLDYVCPAGRIITLGFHGSPSAIAQLSITAREIDIRGSRLHNNKFPDVISLFASGKLDVKEMITHHFPFEQIRAAIALIEDSTIEKGKVILEF